MMPKTLFVNWYVNDCISKVRQDSSHTIGVEFLRKEIIVNNQKYLLQVRLNLYKRIHIGNK